MTRLIYPAIQILTKIWFMLWWCDSFGSVFSTALIQVLRRRTYIRLPVIEEESPINTFVGSISASMTFPAPGGQRTPTFLFIPTKKSIYFHLNKDNGNVYTAARFDRDILCKEDVKCCAIPYETRHSKLLRESTSTEDSHQMRCVMDLKVQIVHPNKTELLIVLIEVKDINDNSPLFHKKFLNLTIPENDPRGSLLPLPLATDSDTFKFGIQGYRLASPSRFFGLRVHRNRYQITHLYLVIIEDLDRETTPSHVIDVIAFDGGGRTGSLKIFIKIADVNDCVPKFLKDSYHVSIYKWFPIYTRILKVRATDDDEGDNGLVRYRIPINTHLFSVDHQTGDVYLVSSLAVEPQQLHKFSLVAIDNGQSKRLSSSVSITIEVKASISENFHISISGLKKNNLSQVPENERPGYTIAKITTSSKASTYEKDIKCQLEPSYGYLALKTTYGNAFLLYTRKMIDREKSDYFVVYISCTNYENLSEGAVSRLAIMVLDKNDNSPQFVGKTTFSIKENLKPGSLVGKVIAFDKDKDANGEVTFTIANSMDVPFNIGSKTGRLTTSRPLDREQKSKWVLQVLATDNGYEKSLFSVSNVTVHVLDQNDNAPQFIPNIPNFVNISSTFTSNRPFLRFSATDADDGANGNFEFQLARNFDSFYVSETGELYYRPRVPQEMTTKYKVQIIVIDRGFPRHSSKMNITVQVYNVNRYRPRFKSDRMYVNLSTCLTNGSTVAKVQAFDSDKGVNGAIRYKFLDVNSTSFPFSIDTVSGDIFLNAPILSSQRTFNIVVQATDLGVPPLSDKLFVNLQFMKKGHNEANFMDIQNRDEGNFVVIIVILLTSFLFFVTFFCIYHVFGAQRRENVPQVPQTIPLRCSTEV